MRTNIRIILLATFSLFSSETYQPALQDLFNSIQRLCPNQQTKIWPAPVVLTYTVNILYLPKESTNYVKYPCLSHANLTCVFRVIVRDFHKFKSTRNHASLKRMPRNLQKRGKHRQFGKISCKKTTFLFILYGL